MSTSHSQIRETLEGLKNGTLLKYIGPSRIGQRASEKVRRDIGKNGHPNATIAREWGRLANQVVGQETKLDID